MGCQTCTIGTNSLIAVMPFVSLALNVSYFQVWQLQISDKVEVEFKHFDVKKVVQKIYTFFSKIEILEVSDDEGILNLIDDTFDPPEWFKENDLDMYGDLYEKS